MASYVTPKKNVAWIGYVSLYDQNNTKVLKANPTIAAGDFKISKDGGAFANLTNLPATTPAGGVSVQISLTATEMNADNIVIACVDASGAEWCDLAFNIQTSVRQIDDLTFPLISGNGISVDSSGRILGQLRLIKNQALNNFQFQMTDSTTHNPVTGKTVTVSRSIDGGAFATIAGSVVEISNGWYAMSLTAADLNGNTVALRMIASGCDDAGLTFLMEP